MRNYIKGYHMFLPKQSGVIYFLLYVYYPLLMILIPFPMELSGEWLLIQMPLVIFLELYIDRFIFNGISAQETDGITILLTSEKGIITLKRGLIYDHARRAFSFIIIVIGIAIKIQLYEQLPSMEFLEMLYFTLTAYIVTTLAILLCRIYSGMALNLTAPWGAIIIYSFLSMTIGFYEAETCLYADIVTLGLGISIAAVAISITIKRFSLNYYDKGSERSV